MTALAQVLPASAHRLFEGDRHATIITVDPDGTPQVSLIWVARDGDEIVFGVEERRRKVQNLRRDPRVVLMIEDDRDGALGLRQYLVVHGTVRFTGPDIPHEWNELMDAQAQRYLGTDFLLPNRGSRTALIGRITPTRIGGWGPWAGK
jgi:PPOX class probable F420-dependent enzyme